MSWNLKHSFGVGLLAGAVIIFATQSAWGINFGQFAPPEKVYIVKVCDDGDLIGTYGLQIPPSGKSIDPNAPFRQMLAQLVTRFPPKVVVSRLAQSGIRTEVYSVGGEC